MKKRWYEVKDGIFSWYHLEEREKVCFFSPFSSSFSSMLMLNHQDINCEPNGCQDMASVVEIMGYSTSNDLQLMFKHCFVFQCSDGQRYQFGVSMRSFSVLISGPINSLLGSRQKDEGALDGRLTNLNGESFTKSNCLFV